MATNGPISAKPAASGKNELQRAGERRHRDDRDPRHRIEQSDEGGIGRHREEVIEAFA
jgi:hypothetical protein